MGKEYCAIQVRDIDPVLKRKFMAALRLRGITMRDAIIYYMERVIETRE